MYRIPLTEMYLETQRNKQTTGAAQAQLDWPAPPVSLECRFGDPLHVEKTETLSGGNWQRSTLGNLMEQRLRIGMKRGVDLAAEGKVWQCALPGLFLCVCPTVLPTSVVIST